MYMLTVPTPDSNALVVVKLLRRLLQVLQSGQTFVRQLLGCSWPGNCNRTKTYESEELSALTAVRATGVPPINLVRGLIGLGLIKDM